MVYKHHQKWRDNIGLNSSVWDLEDLDSTQKKIVRNMRNSNPAIPYILEIECTSYWGNFEREFLGYSLGILDDVQMDIEHSEEERTMFWKEVFNQDNPIDFEDALESYELLKDYLLETFLDCDDWEQLTFYTIDWKTYHDSKRNVLKIQLAKPLNDYWENIIISRMKAFFEVRPYEYMDEEDKLVSIKLFDNKGNVIKEY